MPNLKEIQEPVKNELQEFASYFKSAMADDKEVVNEMVEYISQMQGKQMRPLFLFLSAALHGKINEQSYVAATLIELIHTASLIHDDVVDEAYQRRNKWSVNALWRSKQAVLVGDYILARGIRLAVDNNQYEVIGIMAKVIEDMSKGELLQSDASRNLNIGEKEYFEIIRCKTATLLASCGVSGARSVNAPAERVEVIEKFGNLLGLAFQIKDDILDYTKTNIIGKPISNDIKEKKMTLPLIYALDSVGEAEKNTVLEMLHHVDTCPENVAKIRSFVIANKGIEKSQQKMEQIEQEAFELLDNYPDSEYKTALMNFAAYVLERNK